MAGPHGGAVARPAAAPGAPAPGVRAVCPLAGQGVWEKATGWLSANKRQVPHVRQRQVPLDSPVVRVHQQGTGAKKTATGPLAAAGAATRARCT